MISKLLRTVAAAALLALVAACGGGGSPATTAGGSTGLGVGSGNPPVVTPPAPPTPDPTLRYTDKVLASYTFGYPFLVNKTGLTRVVNQEKQDDNVGSCAFPSDGTVFADGTIPALCKWFTDPSAQYGRWIAYAVNPLAITMATYKGTLPEKLAFTPLGNGGVETKGSVWRFVQEPERDFPAGVAQVARVVDGAYFVPGNATNTLYFRALDGNTTSVQLGTSNESFRVVQTFNN